ncbi:MAG: ZIP family metal transporter [Syntrophomonadaceae bacterium]|nr:ZIP family metal transporter [Syntrophomonadaceae bacterium]
MLDNVMLMSVAAGFCTTIGAMVLFMKRNWSKGSLAAFLGLAAGVMVAVVILDMMPSALLSNYKAATWGMVLGLAAIWCSDRWLGQKMQGPETLLGLGYLIMLGIAMHDLPEGMAIAMGGELKARTGMVIALAIAIHNIPEGMAIAAPLLMGGQRRLFILLQTAAIGLITPLGSAIGKLSLAVLPQMLPWLLGFASGIMLYLVMFQLWPHASAQRSSRRWIGLCAGILIITLATFL